MKVKMIKPERTFAVGINNSIKIKHCAEIELKSEEQVTFITDGGAEYDVVRKSWGYYATPSLNGRLKEFGLRAVLINNPVGKAYLLLVESGKEPDFYRYLESEKQEIICWLDENEEVDRIIRYVQSINLY